MDNENDNLLENVLYKNEDISVYFYDSALLYIIKKTDKIVTALYLITDFISTGEPIKKDIRDISNKILKDVIFLNKSQGSFDVGSIQVVQTNIFHLDSLIKIGLQAGLFSQMNGNIIRDELTNLSKDLEIMGSSSINEPSLKKTYFNVKKDKSAYLKQKDNSGDENTVLYKGQKGQPKRRSNVLNDSIDSKIYIESKASTLIDRKEKILAIVRNKGKVSIKDISMSITGVSEKTIQRDLLSLVETGVLVKEGERRWSTYSLKQ